MERPIPAKRSGKKTSHAAARGRIDDAPITGRQRISPPRQVQGRPGRVDHLQRSPRCRCAAGRCYQHLGAHNPLVPLSMLLLMVVHPTKSKQLLVHPGGPRPGRCDRRLLSVLPSLDHELPWKSRNLACVVLVSI
ncbi:hypothetical protein JVT61DRAFT_11656 [Boletus reticuloceps]|uniref:Uncharacterized protein n=1 Tax=Boletus reticuloceps TaxID=495285 RepID=A0A8I3ABG6_9AGAM|nr:hypothetical protein JVT61DRAFT_11656 [Boletus reticuloceps]